MTKSLFVVKSLVDFRIRNDYCLLMSAAKPQSSQRALELKRVSSESLLGEKRELLIVHNGREYRLRLTQNGKLILTA